MKITNLGEISWVRGFGGINQDEGYAVSVDSLGNIYSTGIFYGDVDFDPGNNEFSISSKGGNDVFVQKLDAFGNFVWATSFGGSSNDDGYSIVTDQINYIYVGGTFKDEVDFGLNSVPVLKTSIGAEDGFCVKIKEPGTSVNEQMESDMTIFPNPTTGLFYVHYQQFDNSGMSLTCKAELYGLDGKLLLQQDINSINPAINVSQYPSGIYLLKITQGESSSQHKLVIQ